MVLHGIRATGPFALFAMFVLCPAGLDADDVRLTFLYK
jgi:hypothetical protein